MDERKSDSNRHHQNAGHFDTSGREVSVPEVAITIDDPTNLNPRARTETYVITANAVFSKTHVKFNVGDTVQFIRAGETRTNYGVLQIPMKSISIPL